VNHAGRHFLMRLSGRAARWLLARELTTDSSARSPFLGGGIRGFDDATRVFFTTEVSSFERFRTS
jgi:hypothetical protein